MDTMEKLLANELKVYVDVLEDRLNVYNVNETEKAIENSTDKERYIRWTLFSGNEAIRPVIRLMARETNTPMSR